MKPRKSSEDKPIEGSTAIAKNASVHYDPDVTHGGHFIQRYDLNDRLENLRLTHENALYLLGHLQKYVSQHNKTVSKNTKNTKANKDGKIL